MLLVFKVNILYKQYQNKDLSSDIMINITEIGYANDNAILE